MSTNEIIELANSVRIGFGRYEITIVSDGWLVVDTQTQSMVCKEQEPDLTNASSFVYADLDEAYRRVSGLNEKELKWQK